MRKYECDSKEDNVYKKAIFWSMANLKELYLFLMLEGMKLDEDLIWDALKLLN